MGGLVGFSGNELQMWVTFALILSVLALYVSEKLPIEVTSIAAICGLLVFFQFFPIAGADGGNLLGADKLLAGFANPALITVLALLVVGQGMVRTGVLERGARFVLGLGGDRAWVSITVVMTVVLVVSAFLNNIPVVVIFIPIMQVLADKLKRPSSKLMMGLSFASVLGGMTTLIGSGTNLLVSSALIQVGERPFSFFDFTVPGLVLAGVGLLYVLIVCPMLLPDRTSLSHRIMERSGKYFLAQITVEEGSYLIGQVAVGGVLSVLHDVRVRMILRGDRVVTPPYHDFEIEIGDVVVIAASRKALAEAMSTDPNLLDPATREKEAYKIENDESLRIGERLLAEVMVAPASRMIGQRLRATGFQVRTRCFVLGVERRAHMIRSRMTDIALEAGDVLLVQGQAEDIRALRGNPDVVILAGTSEELPVVHHAHRAGLIFFGIVVAAATGIVPVVVAALTGAMAMVAVGALNIRQAARAVDSNILTMIPAALAMGAAMQVTGGADYLAHALIKALAGAGPVVVLSAFFLFTAIIANIISAKACAVLFTPIAVGIAKEVGVDPMIFAVAVVFSANCAIATPIGYQTSLLVMGPGHYRFADYFRAGAPLIILLWLAFTIFAPIYYGL